MYYFYPASSTSEHLFEARVSEAGWKKKMFIGFLWPPCLFAFIYIIITFIILCWKWAGDGVVDGGAIVTSGLKVIISLFLSTTCY